MNPAIAIVGAACRYPDADSPAQLWESVLAKRRAFRRIPDERLRRDDYVAADRSAPDRTYVAQAALIDGFELDRVQFHVAGDTFRAADLSHWLALDVAARALADAGFPSGAGLPHETTGVLIGNTLTGEHSRANAMRLRWPYVQRVVDAALAEEGRSPAARRAFLDRLEGEYKAPFEPIGPESLAGSLSNTIAGRICNHFDLGGGGYTLDAACASSLLAVAQACSALVAGDLDVALAGGVDISLDPFELVGFAKIGALAEDEMRVYDARSAGFWPGEGCGVVVLMRHQDAVEQRRRIYALIRGWGISSDGSGGITRPEADGQELALRRAYRRAGFGAETVAYFEGHGTGTAVGDATELDVLLRARADAGSHAPPAVIGSIKANIGHTKAAAGVAGLLKAMLAVQEQILPPTTGCERPHPRIAEANSPVRVLKQGQIWPADRPLRAGVSAMGFGGINTHVVVEGASSSRRRATTRHEDGLLASDQDAELLLLAEADTSALRGRVERLAGVAEGLSRAELGDLSAHLLNSLQAGLVRAAVVVGRPDELARRLESLAGWLRVGVESRLAPDDGIFLGSGASRPRIGFLFPGQGSPAALDGGALRRRFECVDELYRAADLPRTRDTIDTAVAQPAIARASVACLRVLASLGIEASVGVGHSLGELVALHWAGALDEQSLLQIAAMRGQAMAALSSPPGAMASVAADAERVGALLDDGVVVAGLNSPRQTVVSGDGRAVTALVERARASGLTAVTLPVSHAFHSPLVADAAGPLAEYLAHVSVQPPARAVISTVTGGLLEPDVDIRALLTRQVTAPVRFGDAARQASAEADLLLEVGPGQVLGRLVGDISETPTISLDGSGPSLSGLLLGVGAAFALGAQIRHRALLEGRFTRPFDPDCRHRFFTNPCERGPVLADSLAAPLAPAALASAPTSVSASSALQAASSSTEDAPALSPLDLLRTLLAEKAELPISAISPESRLLGDLHLNSIAVGQLVAEAARRLGLRPPVAPTELAGATVAAAARALEEHREHGGASPVEPEGVPPGLDTWIRGYVVDLVERPRRDRPASQSPGEWRVFAPRGHPLAEPLRAALNGWGGGGGVLICLPTDPDELQPDILLAGAKAALAGAGRAVLVQHGGGGAGFLRTLHLEASDLTTCIVDVPPSDLRAVDWVLAEARAASGHVEAYYDAEGRRHEPVWRLLPLEEPGESPLGSDDVLLVTGGGKGIAAECALGLARDSGAQLILLGRSDPAADAELAQNLERLAANGCRARYLAVDVCDAAGVRGALEQAQAELGPVTAILNGAGLNEPRLIQSLDEEHLRRTLATKLDGARNVLAAVDQGRLRMWVAFGSIIARTGLRGEAHYALANEWLARLGEELQRELPDCRCTVLEWSVWSGIGMGARLGSLDRLVRAGITPLAPEHGVEALRRLIARPLPAVSVVVTSRFGDFPTVDLDRPDLPLVRFLERPRVHYPGVELVADADLSVSTDPYLDDHVVQGERVLPAVMGLEAMAQAARAVLGQEATPSFEDVELQRPIVVPADRATTIRVAALVRSSDRVDVAVRCEQTGFLVDHMRAVCRFDDRAEAVLASPRAVAAPDAIVPIEPGQDLYGSVLFHRGRFQRLARYQQLCATECSAEITGDGSTVWFGRYLPSTLLLGDPGSRDAAIHAVQACIPHSMVLPIGVDRIVPERGVEPGPRIVGAHERARSGDTFTYDLEVADPYGQVVERWSGLRLKAVGLPVVRESWPVALLGPYVERRLGDLIPASAVRVALARGVDTDGALAQAAGRSIDVRRRPDGKPEVVAEPGLHVSASHAGDLVFAVAATDTVGCDVEPVAARDHDCWGDLLGDERLGLAALIASEHGDDQDTAATRLWVAGECLKKAGAPVGAALTLLASTDAWITLRAGSLVVATLVTELADSHERVVLGVALGGGDAGV
jgi:enediyne polyketide synthase